MYTVVAQRDLPLPPDALWLWLTDAGLLARWFADPTPAPADGQRVRFDFGDGDFFDGSVTEWDPGITLGLRWKFIGLGPAFEVRFSMLRRKAGTELSIQDRGAITTEEAECLRVGWSEFLLRLDKAVTRNCTTRFSWRKALSLTGHLDECRSTERALLHDPAWWQRALDGINVLQVEPSDGAALAARVWPSDDSWRGSVTDLSIRLRRIRGRDYLFLSHEGWPRLPATVAPAERRRFVGLWRDALTPLGVC